MRWSKGLAFAGLVAISASASAEIPVSPLGDIYESYNDCFKVASEQGMKPEVMASLGWARATVSNGGKPVADAPIIYGHTKRKPIIILSAEKGEGLCVVMARLESRNAFEDFKSAWGGKLPAPDKEGSITFFAEGHPIMLKQTGSADKPAMTISVMTPMEKK